MQMRCWLLIVSFLSGCALGAGEPSEGPSSLQEGLTFAAVEQPSGASTSTTTLAGSTQFTSAASTGITWVESSALDGRLSASAADDRYFGRAVDASGDRIVVMGVAQNSLKQSASVLRRINGVWTSEQVFAPAVGWDISGVALDGNLVAVSERSYSYGQRITVYQYTNGQFVRYAQALPPPEHSGVGVEFGARIDLSGSTLIVGGSPTIVMVPSEGVYRVQGVLREPSWLNVRASRFGERVSISGAVAVVGASSGINAEGDWVGGRVHIYRRYGTSWLENNTLQGDGLSEPSDGTIGTPRFGTDVAVSGTLLAVSAPNEIDPARGVVHRVYIYDVATWARRARIELPEAVNLVAVNSRRVLFDYGREARVYDAPQYGPVTLEGTLPVNDVIHGVALGVDRAYLGLSFHYEPTAPNIGRVQTFWAKPLILSGGF